MRSFITILAMGATLALWGAGSAAVGSGVPQADAPKAQDQRKAAAMAFPITDKSLPYVLVIGDSIPMGYTPPLRKALAADANVWHVPDNAGDSEFILQNLDSWIAASGRNHYKAIVLNAGLHDLEVKDGAYEVPLSEYVVNLQKIILRLRPMADTVMWVNTTVVPEGAAGRRAGDEVKYNAAADAVMKRLHVPIIDIYSLSKTDRNLYWLKQDNVHYNQQGYSRFANEIASQLRPYLK